MKRGYNMAKEQIYEVDGYTFANEKDAQVAENELKGVEYLKQKNKFDNPRKILVVYNRLVSEGIFNTPVGLSYVRELQKFLLESDEIDNNAILPIAAEPLSSGVSKKRIMDRIATLYSNSKYAYRERLKISYAMNIVLIIVVIAMFIITNTSNNVNILNYEEKLIDKYASWEQELSQREAKLRQQE